MHVFGFARALASRLVEDTKLSKHACVWSCSSARSHSHITAIPSNHRTNPSTDCPPIVNITHGRYKYLATPNVRDASAHPAFAAQLCIYRACTTMEDRTCYQHLGPSKTGRWLQGRVESLPSMHLTAQASPPHVHTAPGMSKSRHHFACFCFSKADLREIRPVWVRKTRRSGRSWQ